MSRPRNPTSWTKFEEVERLAQHHPYRYNQREHTALRVLEKIKFGYTNKEISESEGVPLGTITWYLKQYYRDELFKPSPDRIYREVIALALESPEEWRHKAFAYVRQELNRDVSPTEFLSRIYVLGGPELLSTVFSTEEVETVSKTRVPVRRSVDGLSESELHRLRTNLAGNPWNYQGEEFEAYCRRTIRRDDLTGEQLTKAFEGLFDRVRETTVHGS